MTDAREPRQWTADELLAQLEGNKIQEIQLSHALNREQSWI